MFQMRVSASLAALRRYIHSETTTVRDRRLSVEKLLDELSDEEVEALLYDWPLWARDKQYIPDGEWQIWLVMAGRGFGKTRTGAETLRIAKEHYGRIHIVGATSADVRDIMVEGESGILAVSPPWDMPKYEPSKRKITWENGSVANLFSADEPDRLRGPQCSFAWGDELAAWRYEEAFDQLMFGLRLGKDPKAVFTTTPRPTKIIRDLVKRDDVYVTTGTSYENRANLAGAFFTNIIKKYEGTRLGRQELNAEVLEDVPGALWTAEMIDRDRVQFKPKDFKRIVISVDPAISTEESSNETGIIVAGVGLDDHGYILEDASGKYTANEWARKSVNLYKGYQADRIVAERNQGGDMVENTVRTVDNRVAYESVVATRGKRLRAEPVQALYEQHKVHHVGLFPNLEDQMTTWDATGNEASPDRLDALVWALTELMLGEEGFFMW